MLSIRNLHIIYNGKDVLTDFSLHVDDGEVVCLRGESGCGKTSVLRAVLGFIDYGGTIALDGEQMTERNTGLLRQRMSYVPQEFVMPHETVTEMVASVMDLNANCRTAYTKDSLLKEWGQLGLDSTIFNKLTSELSGGQRQRIMLSICGMQEKRLLLVDEPTSALDTDTTRLVAEYVTRLARQKRMAVLAVTHSDVFADMCDKKVSFSV